MSFAKFLRTPFLQNTSGGLLLRVVISIFRSSCSEVCLRPATSLKKRHRHRCSPVDSAKFLRKTFFAEHLRSVTATDYFGIKVSDSDPGKLFYMPCKNDLFHLLYMLFTAIRNTIEIICETKKQSCRYRFFI